MWDHEGSCLEPAFKLMDNKEGHQQAKQLVKEFIKRYGIDEVYVGMESTGGYESNWFLLFKAMNTEGVSKVMRINPKAVKATGTARMVRTVTDTVSADNIAQYMLSFASQTVHQQDNQFRVVRHVGAWIKNVNKQINQTGNHLEKVLYQSFPELLLYCRHGFADWLLNMLEKYPLAADIIKAGKSKLCKLSFISEQKAVAILTKAKNTVGQPGADDLLRSTIKGMVTVLIINRQQVQLQKKALTTQFKSAEEVTLLDSIPGIAEDTAVLLMMDIESIDNYGKAKQLCAHYWMGKYSGNEDYRNTHSLTNNLAQMHNSKEQQKLKDRIKQLEEELKRANLRADLWQTMIEVAEQQLKIDIKKKYGAQL